MSSSVKMKKIDILVLDKHVNKVVALLGFENAIEFIARKTDEENGYPARLEYSEKFYDIKTRFTEICVMMDVRFTENELDGQKEYLLHLDEIEKELTNVEDNVLENINRIKSLEDSKRELKQMYQELDSMGYLNFNLNELSGFDFTYLVYGNIPKSKISVLEKQDTSRFLFIPIGDSGDYICVASKKGKWALESLLKKIEFKQKEMDRFKNKTVAELIQETQEKLNQITSEIEQIETRFKMFVDNNHDLLIKLKVSINIEEDMLEATKKFTKTGRVTHISGWIEKDKLDEITKELIKITDNKIYINIFEPYELPGYKHGEIKVPVKLKQSKFVSNFQILVKNYGLPEYGEIDPTIIVAITYMFMFGLMFGDIGQGFVFFLIGVLMKLKVKLLKRFSHFGVLFMGMGLCSMLFGTFYGSFFGNEHVLKPLFVSPMHGFMRLFLLAIAFGAVFISFGIIINIINLLNKHKYYEALFEKTGLFGLWFYWGSLTIVIRTMVFNKAFSITGLDVIFLMFCPLFLLFLNAPLYWFIEKKHGHRNEGIGSVILESIIELIEIVIYYLGSTASFMRMGALALAHAALSFAIFTMAGLLKGSITGEIFAIVIIFIGNVFIIVLEGLVASIQTMRLQYYEFFSKFFSGEGKGFKPFKIEKVK